MSFEQSFNRDRGNNRQELGKPNRQESKLPVLSGYLRQLADQTNRGYRDNHPERQDEIIDQDGRVNMTAFRTVNGGPLAKEAIKKHQRDIQLRKLEWSGAYNYNNEQDQQKALDIYERSRRQSKPELMEMASVAAFHKAFGQDFLVVRASEYDDYFHGVDNLMVDRATGNVVCAFDEVHDRRDGERYNKKNQQIIKAAKQGGKTIDYGLSIDQQGKLQKLKLENIPMFYLAMDSEELDTFLADLNLEQAGLSASEQSFLTKLLDSIEQQKNMLLAQADLPDKIVTNLEAFAGSLNKLRSTLQNQIAPQKI